MYDIILKAYDVMRNMYDLAATGFKYLFIIVIYLFIFSVIRMIYLDIRQTGEASPGQSDYPYLKLISRREKFNFKILETYVLDEDKSIGRSSKNEIIIQDPFLSKKHVLFTVENDHCFIQDLNSTNGTFVNDEELGEEAVILSNGDKIHIGQLDFIFVHEGDEDA